MKSTIIFIWLLIMTVMSPLMGQETATGYVFSDKNMNRMKDRGEKGIPGVAVSNGTEVVLTGQNGEYRIGVGKDHIIFVIKPSGYQVPHNAHNLPQFYYNHKPLGSPELEFGGVSPTGPLPEMVNFPLYPVMEPEEWQMLVFGDPQPRDSAELSYLYKGLVSEIEGVKGTALGLSMGDLMFDDLSLFPYYKDIMSKAGIPWYNVMGNHDMNYDAAADSLSDETFELHFGPSTYAFNQAKVHFIILDDILYPHPLTGKGYWGGFRKDQLEFIKNDLKYVPKDHLVVLAFHIPISEREGWNSFRAEDRTALFQLLRDFPYTLTLSAHTHFQSQDFFTRENRWLQDKPHHHYNVGTSCGDWFSGIPDANGVPVSTMRDGTPKGYAYINFAANQYTIDYKVAGKPASYQIEIYLPRVVKANMGTSAQIAANFFMGSPADSLFFRVDDGEWKVMRYLETYDPSYLKMLFDFDAYDEYPGGRRPSNPDYCNHIWFAGVPTRLNPGIHSIEVKAIDMFGREHRQSKQYRVVE